MNVVIAAVIALLVGRSATLMTQSATSARSRFLFPPVDDAAQAPSFVAFRTQLLEALRRRDAAQVLTHVDESIYEIGGKEAFAQALSSNRGDDDYFRLLARVLEHGGAFTTTRGRTVGRREFCAPYVYSNFPRPVPESLTDEVDPWAVIQRDVIVRSRASDAAPAIERLSYELVKTTGAHSGHESRFSRWYEVELAESKRGWVAASALMNPADYHACFARIGERWLLVDFSRRPPP